jgi:hypothetical protein
MSDYRPRGYEDLKELAQGAGVNIPDLLALARSNDPFFCGSPAQLDKAQWFADLWQRFGYSTGVHLRRVHYRLVSQYAPTMHDGTPYENTERCWGYLCDAGKYARYLGLVPVEAFEDHRNPEPQIMAWPRYGEPEPGWQIEDPAWYLPEIDADLGAGLAFALPQPDVSGYDYAAADQPYHVELWIEKSTMNDVLRPVCSNLGVNLVTSLGFQSITSVVSLLKRIAEGDKPARIFYISDFDPAGDGMPTAVARQVEYWLADFAPDIDIKLTPLALTRDQVLAYRLPRIPIKESDKRRGGFEERHGEGAVELDALEALYPGVLARIVREALAPYRDQELVFRLARREREARRSVLQEWADETGAESSELAELEAEALAIVDQYRARLAALAAELASDLAPVRERLDVVQQAIQDKIGDFEPDLPDRPEPETEDADESDWLFDAGREYLDQLEVYQARKGGAS